MSESKAVATVDEAALLEQVIVQGDLARLAPEARVAYYRRVTESLGLNPFTRPFEYITLNGKLTLYAKRDATDQLRRIHNISVSIVSRERMDDVYLVTARATTPDGRSDESIGAVNLDGLRGDALANALMKAETKGKRRVTLSIVGLGWLDETEIETIHDTRPAAVDHETGEIPAARQPPTQRSAPAPQPSAANLATPAQVRAIYAIGRNDHNLDEAEIEERCGVLFGAKPAELTRKQASEFITALKSGQSAPASGHRLTRADLETAWPKLVEKAQALSVGVPPFKKAWTDAEITAHYKAAKEEIAEAEDALEALNQAAATAESESNGPY